MGITPLPPRWEQLLSEAERRLAKIARLPIPPFPFPRLARSIVVNFEPIEQSNDARPSPSPQVRAGSGSVDVATGKDRGRVTLERRNSPDDAMISNDGRTLAYVREVETRTDVCALDFTELLKAVRP